MLNHLINSTISKNAMRFLVEYRFGLSLPLNAEKFIRDPFCNDPGAHLYKTGGLGRYLPDGTLELLGRLDSQLKIRGFRIEPKEVETRLMKHPAVLDAVVVGDEAGAAADGHHRSESLPPNMRISLTSQ